MPTSSHSELGLAETLIYAGFSGQIAGISICYLLLGFSVYPIDIVKTKLQGLTKLAYDGPIDCVKKIVKKEGIRGMYRGFPPNLILIFPEKGIKISVNNAIRQYFGAGDHSLEVAGAGAGFCQVTMTNPMELLKIQGATQIDKFKKGEIAKMESYPTLVRRFGIKGLYTGVNATLLRDIPFSMVYFSGYAKLFEYFDQGTLGHNMNGFVSGSIAGTFAAGMTTPLDVIKTRVHSRADPSAANSLKTNFFINENRLIVSNFKAILAKEGIPALYKGIVPRCMIISPLFGITMTCFEAFCNFGEKQKKKKGVHVELELE